MNFLRQIFGGKEIAVESKRSGFEAVDFVTVTRACADATQQHLRTAGQTGNEGLVVWSGTQDGSTFHVRTVTVPQQRPIRSAEGVCVVLDSEALHRMNVDLHKRRERLFAQVHSHPGRAYHSPMDDRYAVVTAAGGLSLVVPDFAVRPFNVSDCAVYRLASSGKWIEVPERKADRLIAVVGDAGL
jgi:hypothetical protein